jgi:MFS family permease
MPTSPTAIDNAPEPSNQDQRSRYYLLGLLTVVYSFNFIDRQLLSILQESVKKEMLLSDAQLGLLTGFAFAMFYVLAGLPIARWADRGNRRNIVAGSLVVWSLMTALCGMAQNYWQLLAARIGVGVGEAGGSPPSHSMISDTFPPEQRATALSFYSVGINIGILFGFLLGGYLNEVFGWRVAFLVVGLPGVLLGVVVRYTIAEPVRGRYSLGTYVHKPVPFFEVVSLLVSRRSFRHIAIGSGLAAFVGYAASTWMASFMIRSHGMATGELGVWLALTIGVGGGIGTFCAGMFADKLAKKDKRWYAWLPACAALGGLPFFAWTMLAASSTTALTVHVGSVLVANAYLGASIAVMHGMVGAQMRAVASAIFFLVLNIIGLGLGPWTIGVYSDYLLAEFGKESLRYSLLTIIPIVGVWASVHFFLAAKTLREDLANAPA